MQVIIRPKINNYFGRFCLLSNVFLGNTLNFKRERLIYHSCSNKNKKKVAD